MKKALVLGGGGFIGSHMVKKLKKEGYWVRAVDLKYPEFSKTEADEFIIGDLTIASVVAKAMYISGKDRFESSFDLVFQYAADMGGANYIFSGDYDSNVMNNSALINLNVAHWASIYKPGCLLYSSSACVYPQQIQDTPDNKGLKESDAYPVNPDSEYGYEKIFSERLYAAYGRNYGLNFRMVRFHNVFGEDGTIEFLKAKAPAALCRKVAECSDGGTIEVMGDGLQTRSFLYIDEAIEGCWRLVQTNYKEPINIGSNEMISINDLANMIIAISGKSITIKNVASKAIGVRGRNSDNSLCEEVLGWSPNRPLKEGIEKLYHWVNAQLYFMKYGDKKLGLKIV